MANDTQTYKRRMETEALLWDVIPTDPSGRTDISRIPRERAQSVANFAWEVCAFPSTMSTNLKLTIAENGLHPQIGRAHV